MKPHNYFSKHIIHTIILCISFLLAMHTDGIINKYVYLKEFIFYKRKKSAREYGNLSNDI